MRTGELAASGGVSVDTIRHYERAGLLPRAVRSANGYREFPAEAGERLRVVRAALAVGFTVEELGRVFAERERNGAPCRAVRELAAAKLAEIVRQERELRELRRTLSALIENWDVRLASQPAGTRAHLLDDLASTSAPPARKPRPRLPKHSKEKS
jgi:DNA-binding transcriptional MerR regulator